MKKNSFVKFTVTWLAVFALLPAAAFAAAPDAEFDATQPLFYFLESFAEKPSLSIDLEFGTSAKIYQTQDTIVAYYDSEEEGYIAFYKTKNPKLVFGKDVCVGANIQNIIKGKEIPGEMQEFPMPPGESLHQWTLPNSDLVFMVKAIDNKISEITFRDPGSIAAIVNGLLIQ